MFQLLERIGRESLYLLEVTGRMGIFLGTCLLRIVTPPYKLRPVIRQIHFIGAKSIFVIIFTGAFTGMVLGLQGYYTLRKFGSEGLLGSAVALSLLRELGPVLTALMVIGRAGSAITAEIGIMRNSEQIDALECMAIDPFRYLLVPKFLGGIIAMPLLTFIFDVVGIAGGWAVGVGLLGVNEGVFLQSMYKAVVWHDINMGIIKALVFGLVVIWICSVKGYYLHMERTGGFGAEGVSRTTTSAVVLSSVSILVWDYLISAMMI
ncbi:phospholipid/cholesterol/gamma-HCH transport system permease protein [Geothermobacter ehrlichii]|uniref:Phospholipid/cholesterol/gamma-HCH transport system permease protein n=1 Tax=Geothermobacter ehrlichii TaxID=213224 RepID=A0A5D3WL81_9BACT|nr:MlaE family lipid ABC transporter permease subunit [Geothermobacter ehrlichii]TYO98723.1 phospholipid/cholesterol/gamma-HCH transport system permease protein [Geothermobacter ehrlichii]